MPRRFGPTLGAGTVIIEKEAGKTITPAPTGTTVYVGRTEKGETDQLLMCPTQRDYIANCGTYIDGSELPNAAFDLFNLSTGGASLYVVRVTDGTETDSLLKLYNRRPGTGEYSDRNSGNFRRSLIAEVSAKSGGRWGGARREQAFSFTLPGDLTETTLATGETMLEDELVGGYLTLSGVSGGSYEIIGNDVSGVITVSSDSTMATDLATGADPTNNKASAYVATEIRSVTAPGQVSGDRRALTVTVIAAEDTTGNYFGLEVLEDGDIVKTYRNLSLDPANKYWAETVINEDESNPYIEIDVTFTGSFSDVDNLPANWVGEFNDNGTTIITDIPVCHPELLSSTNTSVGWIGGFEVPFLCQPVELTVELTGAAAFKVYADGDYGLKASDGVLATGTVGTQWEPDAALDFLPKFTVYNGEEAFTAGDTFRIIIDPLSVDVETGEGLLRDGYFYPDKNGLVRYQIEDNTPDSITLKNAMDPAPAINEALDETDFELTTAITFPMGAVQHDMGLISSEYGKLTIDGGAVAHALIGDLVTALNANWQAQTGEVSSPFKDGGGNILAFDTSAIENHSNLGADDFLAVDETASSADMNAISGAIATGNRGDQWRIEAPEEFEGGYDGGDPIDADFTAAFNTVDSLINRLQGLNVGLAKIACPGVTSTVVQKAGIAYADAKNYQYRVEIPSSFTTETSAVNYINQTIGRSDYGVVTWPSYGYVVNPLGEGLILQTLTGAIQGREAAVARDYSGYHKAAAGVDVTIPNMIKDVLDGAPVNQEILNPNGIGTILKLRGNWCVWGDRTISVDPAWKWKHQREQMSHYEHQLAENFDWLIFMINDPATQATVAVTLRAFFIPEWQKRALRGAKFEDACTIKVDSENNTDLTRAAGDLNCDISLRLADTVERFIITIGKKGIFDQAG